VAITSFSQRDSADNYVKGFLTIPAFKINIVPDSSMFTNDNLKKNMPVMIMFFSPDCDHCQKQIKEMMAYKQELKNIQIVMISPLSYKDNKTFYDEYALASMPNIRLGFDVTFKLRNLYQTTTYPSMYVYDKNGTLAKAFVGNIAVPAIIAAVAPVP